MVGVKFNEFGLTSLLDSETLMKELAYRLRLSPSIAALSKLTLRVMYATSIESDIKGNVGDNQIRDCLRKMMRRLAIPKGSGKASTQRDPQAVR